MLQLLGLLLKAIITIAIGMMGFTWEPKEDARVPEKKENRGEFMLPVLLNSGMGMTLTPTARPALNTDNCDSIKSLSLPVKPKPSQLPDVPVVL